VDRIIDTNVGVVANLGSSASAACALACVRLLRDIVNEGRLALDDRERIFNEYRRYLSLSGAPGVGDEFMRWVHDNQYNEAMCRRVTISAHEARGFTEFPEAESLTAFDRADRKFVAVARAHPCDSTIFAALDRGWKIHQAALAQEGVQVSLVCPDDI